MTKKELQKQIDELRVRIETLEARPYNIFTYPQPYVVTNSMGAPLPFPGSTTTCNNESTQEERYGNK